MMYMNIQEICMLTRKKEAYLYASKAAYLNNQKENVLMNFFVRCKTICDVLWTNLGLYNMQSLVSVKNNSPEIFKQFK